MTQSTAPGIFCEWNEPLALCRQIIPTINLPPECRPGLILNDMDPSFVRLIPLGHRTR